MTGSAGQEKPPGKVAGPRSRPGISFYLTLMNLAMLCLVLLPTGYLFLHQSRSFQKIQLDQTIQRLRHEMESRGSSLTTTLALHAGQAAAGYDFSLLGTMVSQVVEHDQEILYCMVMDANRQVLAHNDSAMPGSVLQDDISKQAAELITNVFPQTRPKQAAMGVETIKYELTEIPDAPVHVLEIVAPVYSGMKLWGALRCGYSREGLRQTIQSVESQWAAKMRQFSYSIAGLIALFFVVGIMIAILFTRQLTRSTRQLSDGVDRIAQGELTHHINASAMFSLEFQHYAAAFNIMTEKLRQSHAQLEDYSRSLEQKVDERTQELRETQAELVKQAHEAGKAEMAVGVLHNIGNAITPAKVAITLLLRRLEKSPLRTIGSSIEKLRGELQTPGSLVHTEKNMLIELARLLPASIREEYDKTISEIQKIRDKHEHIEAIIGLQMRYARLVGANEPVNVNEVVRDAMKILSESITNRQITVAIDLPMVPAVPLEKSKLIQIVINLLKNGYEAMDGAGLAERTLAIRTWHEPDDSGDAGQVCLAIHDTGCGFDAETGENLFKFGFTTKKGGSGFGLHSCANYLIANNGAITAHSDGPGKGAEFIIRLPVAITEEKKNV